ncbi:unnamed protein product [Ceratitis capitata]|uniref:(Mediterranean fruit fly) hypothetical protein n=1 Tax=Ceratitis capitata TaxID=7213 RepID=A0A811UB07_CERCA|nr:unnamed protein product [Ceratitis capitata]
MPQDKTPQQGQAISATTTTAPASIEQSQTRETTTELSCTAMPQQHQQQQQLQQQVPATQASRVRATTIGTTAASTLLADANTNTNTTTTTTTETETESTTYSAANVDMRRPNSIYQHEMSLNAKATSLEDDHNNKSNSCSGSALLTTIDRATHQLHGQQTTVQLPSAAYAPKTSAATSTQQSGAAFAGRLPSVDNENHNKCKNKGLFRQQQQKPQQKQRLQQTQQARTIAAVPTKSTLGTAEKANHKSAFFPSLWTSPDNRGANTVFHIFNVIFFMLCLIACGLAFYSIDRHSRNEVRLRKLLQLDERINALELRLQLCEQRQQPLSGVADSVELLGSSNLHNRDEQQLQQQQVTEPKPNLSLDVTQTLHKLSRQVSDLHRLRRDVSHLQLSRRQQQRRQTSLATVTTVDGLLLQTPQQQQQQQTHSGECGCTAVNPSLQAAYKDVEVQLHAMRLQARFSGKPDLIAYVMFGRLAVNKTGGEAQWR